MSITSTLGADGYTVTLDPDRINPVSIDAVSLVGNFAFANPAGLGNTLVVAAQGAGIKIRVMSMAVISTLAQTVKFQSGTTDKSASFPVAANGGLVLSQNDRGWFETAANEALNINLSVATATGVQVVWVAV